MFQMYLHPIQPLSFLQFWALDRWEGVSLSGRKGMQLTFPHHLIATPPHPKSSPTGKWNHQVRLPASPSLLGRGMGWGGWGARVGGMEVGVFWTTTLLTTGAPDDVLQKCVLRCHQPSLAPRHPGSGEQRPGSAAGEGGMQAKKVEEEEEKVEEKIEPKEEGARRRRRGPLTVSPARPGWAALGRRTRQFMVVALPRPPLPRLWRCRTRGSGTAGSAGHSAPAPPPLSLSRRCWCWGCCWGCYRGGRRLGAGSASLPPTGERKRELKPPPSQSPSAQTETPSPRLRLPVSSSTPSRSELRAEQRSPTSGLCAWWLLVSPEIEASDRCPIGPVEWEKRVPERAVASRRLTSRRLPLGSRIRAAGADAAPGAEVRAGFPSSRGWEQGRDWLGGARGRRAATWRCYRPPPGSGAWNLPEHWRFPHRPYPTPEREREPWGPSAQPAPGMAPATRAGLGVWGSVRPPRGVSPRTAEHRRRAASPPPLQSCGKGCTWCEE